MAKANGRPTIGVDLGGTNITSGLVDAERGVVCRHKIDTEAHGGFDHVVDRLAECVNALLNEAGTTVDDVAAVGVGVPGAIDAETRIVLEAVNLGWNDVDLVAALSQKLNKPVSIDNDVNVGTWGAYKQGAGAGSRSLLGVFVGTGIGGGYVFDGELYRGAFGTAGEIGHTLINPFAPFGSQTLEQLASRKMIVNKLVNMIGANHPSVLPELAGEKWPNVRSKPLAKALAEDDKLVMTVLRDAAHAIGVAIANSVTLLSLDCVVIGGGLTEALDERWMGWIQSSFEQAVFPDRCRDCKVVASTLGDDAGLIGAALLAEHELA